MVESVVNEAGAETPAETAPEADLFDLSIDLEPILPDPLLPGWFFLQDYPLLLFVLMFALGYGVGKAIQWVLRTTLSHAVRRTETMIDDVLVKYLTAPVVQTTVILALVAAMKSFGFEESVDRFLVRLIFRKNQINFNH